MHIWLGGLFAPEAYITATRQCVAQANLWPLEELYLEVKLLPIQTCYLLITVTDDNRCTVTGCLYIWHNRYSNKFCDNLCMCLYIHHDNILIMIIRKSGSTIAC